MADKLIIAAGTDADQYYATNLALSSPFITLCRGKKRYLAAGGFEYPQAAAAWPTTRFEDLGKNRKEVIKNFCKKHNIKNPLMPAATRAATFINVPKATLTDAVFPEREIKSAREIKKIRAVQKVNETAIRAVRDVLHESTIVSGKAKYKGKWLTSEYLKRIAAVELAKENCTCPDMIISSGKQTAMPHDEGSGTIREGAIVVDIFPKSNETHYFSDCTRTFVIGAAPKHFEERYAAVLQVQKEGIKKIRAGAKDIEKWSHDRFKELGFTSDYKAGTGYIHSLGHGVGLDIHEQPSFRPALKAGNVMTVEPGLYYDYGIRIEDIGVVTKTRYVNFVSLDKNPYL